MADVKFYNGYMFLDARYPTADSKGVQASFNITGLNSITENFIAVISCVGSSSANWPITAYDTNVPVCVGTSSKVTLKYADGSDIIAGPISDSNSPRMTLKHGDVAILISANGIFRFIPVSSISNMFIENGVITFSDDITVLGSEYTYSQLIERLNTVAEWAEGALKADKDGNLTLEGDVLASGGNISLKETFNSLKTLLESYSNHIQAYNNLVEYAEQTQTSLAAALETLEKCVLHNDDGSITVTDVTFKDAEANDVLLSDFYGDMLDHVEDYVNSYEALTTTVNEHSSSIQLIISTMGEISQDNLDIKDSFTEIQTTIETLKQNIEQLTGVDVSGFLALNEANNLVLPEDLYFNGETLPEGYKADSQSLIEVIKLLATDTSAAKLSASEAASVVEGLQNTIADMQTAITNIQNTLINYDETIEQVNTDMANLKETVQQLQQNIPDDYFHLNEDGGVDLTGDVTITTDDGVASVLDMLERIVALETNGLSVEYDATNEVLIFS